MKTAKPASQSGRCQSRLRLSIGWRSFEMWLRRCTVRPAKGRRGQCMAREGGPSRLGREGGGEGGRTERLDEAGDEADDDLRARWEWARQWLSVRVRAVLVGRVECERGLHRLSRAASQVPTRRVQALGLGEGCRLADERKGAVRVERDGRLRLSRCVGLVVPPSWRGGRRGEGEARRGRGAVARGAVLAGRGGCWW